jgi:hypothetical protein
VRSYRAAYEDMHWAPSGVMARVANREAASVVSLRLEDVGFKELNLIHLVGDRVLGGRMCCLFSTVHRISFLCAFPIGCVGRRK